MKHKIIYRILNEDDSCKEYYFNCIGDTLEGFAKYYQENYNYLDSKPLSYLLEHYSHFLYEHEITTT